MDDPAQSTDVRMVGDKLPHRYPHREVLGRGGRVAVGVTVAIAVAVAVMRCRGNVSTVPRYTDNTVESRQTDHDDDQQRDQRGP